MYSITKTIKKAFSEGGVVGVVGAVSLAVGVYVATQAKRAGIEIEPEWVVTGLTAIGAAVYRGVANWLKNRRK